MPYDITLLFKIHQYLTDLHRYTPWQVQIWIVMVLIADLYPFYVVRFPALACFNDNQLEKNSECAWLEKTRY